MTKEMAAVLDIVLLVGFGAWAYLVARGKGFDPVAWALGAAVAFFGPGYLMQAVIFPAVRERFGWPETWQRPSAFIAGGVCALIVVLYLTLFARRRSSQ